MFRALCWVYLLRNAIRERGELTTSHTSFSVAEIQRGVPGVLRAFGVKVEEELNGHHVHRNRLDTMPLLVVVLGGKLDHCRLGVVKPAKRPSVRRNFIRDLSGWMSTRCKNDNVMLPG